MRVQTQKIILQFFEIARWTNSREFLSFGKKKKIKFDPNSLFSCSQLFDFRLTNTHSQFPIFVKMFVFEQIPSQKLVITFHVA